MQSSIRLCGDIIFQINFKIKTVMRPFPHTFAVVVGRVLQPAVIVRRQACGI